MKTLKSLACIAVAVFTVVSCGGPKVSENSDAKQIAEMLEKMEENQSGEAVLENLDALIEILAKYQEADEEQIVEFMKSVSVIGMEREGYTKEQIEEELAQVGNEELLEAYNELCVGLSLVKAMQEQ